VPGNRRIKCIYIYIYIYIYIRCIVKYIDGGEVSCLGNSGTKYFYKLRIRIF
jgi:hypothetical protein